MLADQPRPRRPPAQGARELSEADSHPSALPGRVARNTLYSAVGEASNLLLLPLLLATPRFLGPVPFGLWKAATAFVGFFRVLPDLGMGYASTLEISRERSAAGRLTNGLLGFQGALSVLTVALSIGIAWWLFRGDASVVVPVAILSVDLVLKTVKFTLRFLLKSLERFDAEALSLLIERLALLGLGLWVLWAGGGVVAFILVFVLVRLIDVGGLWAYVSRRALPLRPRVDRRLWAELARKGFPFAYASLVITLVFYVDQILLERLRGPVEVAWYGAPTLVLEGLTMAPRILGYAFIPAMAALFETRPDAVTALYRRGCKYLVLLSLPIAAFGYLESKRFVALLWPLYGPSAAAARILLPCVVFMFVSNFSETTLACIGRWRVIVLGSTAALVLNVALNLAWIPAFGYIGSSWATLATEAFYFIVTAAAVWRRGYGPSWLHLVARPLGAAALFSATLWLFRGLPLPASSALASGAWLGGTFLLRVWDDKERAALAGLLRGRAPDPRSLT